MGNMGRLSYNSGLAVQEQFSFCFKQYPLGVAAGCSGLFFLLIIFIIIIYLLFLFVYLHFLFLVLILLLRAAMKNETGTKSCLEIFFPVPMTGVSVYCPPQ